VPPVHDAVFSAVRTNAKSAFEMPAPAGSVVLVVGEVYNTSGPRYWAVNSNIVGSPLSQ
jgi:hypothetical protein